MCKSLQFIRRERETERERERVLEKCGQVRSRHRHRLQLQSSSPVCVPTGGPRTWLQLRHYLSPSPFIALALPLSLTRAQRSGRRSALLCSALHVCVSVYVRVCVSARVCEELLVLACLRECMCECVGDSSSTN